MFSEFFDFVPNYPLLTPSWVELVDLRWCQQGDSLRGGEELHLKGEGGRKVRSEERRGERRGGRGERKTRRIGEEREKGKEDEKEG